MRVVIDSSNAERGNFTQYDGPVPPAGLYKARVSSAKWAPAASGNQMLTVVLEFDTDNENKKQYNGFAVWHRLVQVPQSMWRTNEFLTAIGQPTKLSLDIDESGKVLKIGSARPGKVWCLVKVSADTYQGNPTLKVDSVNPLPGTVTADEIDDDELEDVVSDGDVDEVSSDNPPF
jgi:hypothetical protein